MNDEDRKAYSDWLVDFRCRNGFSPQGHKIWQAACEHKQREIDALKGASYSLLKADFSNALTEINELKARVARLEGFAKDVHRWTVPDPYDERDAPPLQDRLRKAAWAVLQEGAKNV